MTQPIESRAPAFLSDLHPTDERFAVQAVEKVIEFAQASKASDIHFLPGAEPGVLDILQRVDGVLQPVGSLPRNGQNVISRLKVLSNLLTYRTDVPQEGRIRDTGESVEMRVSTFPTVHGEKAVVRLFVGSGEYRFLSDLELPTTIEDSLKSLLQRTSGLLLVCGPAGSGKTTTLYAAFREIQKGGFEFRSLCTLEDPVEAILPGVSQSQVKPDGDFNYHRGLASLLRQDPEVIMVGEIRDPQTAQVVFQASMTGHLVLSSFHAGRAADAVSRLADMRVEPYVLRTGLLAILAQRLLRRTCSCRRHDTGGCRDCHQTGYRGRLVVAEMLQPSSVDIANAILRREDARRIQELAVATGMVPLRTVAENLVEQGLTTSDEVIRVFGIE